MGAKRYGKRKGRKKIRGSSHDWKKGVDVRRGEREKGGKEEDRGKQ